jgi:hypothetical protein
MALGHSGAGRPKELPCKLPHVDNGRLRHSASMFRTMPLPRFQLFELEDLPWFPPVIRDLATDYLHFIERRFDLHKPVVTLLRRALEQSTLARVVDLCSGGGWTSVGLV